MKPGRLKGVTIQQYLAMHRIPAIKKEGAVEEF